MPDSSSGTAAFLSGEEIVNDGRTMAYLEAGYGPPGLQISGGCSCPSIRELIGCDSEPYSSPISDPAPWYDASVPESADFAGFLTTDFKGLGSTYTRENVDKITGGAVLGRLRPKSRSLVWRGYLFGRSECAVQYGLQWFTANLRGTNCSCTGEDLDLMVCCPELTETPSLVTCASLPPISKPEACPPFTQPDAFRTLKKVGLVDGPTIISQRRIGCSPSCGNTTCRGESLAIEIEFTLTAGNPYLYGCPVCLCVDQGFPIADTSSCDWVKIPEGGSPETDAFREEQIDLFQCGGEVCPPIEDCTTIDDACALAVLPVIPEFKDKCFCDPVVPVQVCCTIPEGAFSKFFDGAPIIEIYSGSRSMRATTVRFFANPQGLECCTTSSNVCLECDSLQIRYIPANSTMTIDGTTRTVTVLCAGATESVIGDHLTVTPFSWPILECVEFCICVETEGIQVASDARVTISVVPREI